MADRAVSVPALSLMKKMLIPVIGAGMLASCSTFEPDYVECPSVSARDGYDNVALTGADHGQEVTMRLNGVGTRCYAIEGGHRMEVELGLFIRRLDEKITVNERVKVDLTLVYLDADDQVVGRDIYEDEAYIGTLKTKSRPVFPFSVDVPEGTRVVIGLGRAVQ
ncbi:MAG: hypothetical protein ACON4P_03845 [Candidatus Puniceispirillales bacterium]